MKNNFIFLLSCKTAHSFCKIFSFIFCLFILLCFQYSFAQHTVIDSVGNAYFFHVNDYPNNQSPFWGDDDALSNGIAHDDKYWYIAALATDRIGRPNGDWGIRKIPVGQDLLADYNDQIDKTVYKSDVLALKNYGHAGDLDCCLYNGKYYLVVPFTGDGLPPIVAFFRASDLHFINYAKLTGQGDVGWCAVPGNNSLRLYSSEDRTNIIRHYIINWNIIFHHPTNHYGLTLTQKSYIKNQNDDIIYLNNMQGGEFTSDGKLLYINCGIIDCFGNGGPQQYEDGINVISTSNWKIIQHSSNKSVETNPAHGSKIRPAQTSCFDYTFDNTGCSGEEPEGLTIWDMDKVSGHDSHISGQLHVISYNHNTSVFNENKVFLKHYKRFNFPPDITVYGTTASNGEPATNPKIAAFLKQGTTYDHCADILYNHPPRIFPPGKTPVVFTVTDYTNVRVQDTAYVTVINKHDECSTALTLNAGERITTDNFCATPSESIPVTTCYNGVMKDVWFKIIPSSKALSVETYQVENGLTDLVMQAFSGTCSSLHEIACDDNGGDEAHAKITLSGLVNSDPVYIRVTDQGGNNYGKFGIQYEQLATRQPGNNFFTIYPNPTTGVIQILSDTAGEFEVQILDISGRLMLPKERFTTTKQIDLSAFGNGIYFADIYDTNADKKVVKKIVKMN